MFLKNLILGSAAVLLFASPIYAHSAMESANITNGSNYEKPPTSFKLGFSKVVGLSNLSLKTKAGEIVVWDYEAPKTMQVSYDISMPVLSVGEYVLNWSAVSKDGHVMRETIRFSIGLGKQGSIHYDTGHHDESQATHPDS